MISNIAHQWRQPLNVLALLAQDLPRTLRLGELSEEYLDDKVGKMMQAITQMPGTIGNFRNFLSPGKEKVRFRVLEAVGKTVSLVDPSLQALEIEISLLADPVIEGSGRVCAGAAHSQNGPLGPHQCQCQLRRIKKKGKIIVAIFSIW
ncbi:hypothetical protein KP004_19240 [Geomonas oryzisoli]|uniref:histidine kinase n=1 Tax=Geomonas oryzisoli TaxID=2847992 RepID=A0ABX8J4Q1_9BACT|nr:hypothetical protein [Geomonas oryzisoli]QWV93275.1 hypothetical protein KP004_19240 [Geomonas oryzisoli]